jgi:hypothetical protein
MDTGELWSFLRSLLSRGGDIWIDHQQKSYEEYSARLDVAAREQVPKLMQLLSGKIKAPPSETCEQPAERATVTLSADEFQALMAKEQKLTADLADADRINGESVNRMIGLEHANTALVARVNRLRERIGKAYDVLAAASSDDAVEHEHAQKAAAPLCSCGHDGPVGPGHQTNCPQYRELTPSNGGASR